MRSTMTRARLAASGTPARHTAVPGAPAPVGA